MQRSEIMHTHKMHASWKQSKNAKAAAEQKKVTTMSKEERTKLANEKWY